MGFNPPPSSKFYKTNIHNAKVEPDKQEAFKQAFVKRLKKLNNGEIDVFYLKMNP